MKKFVSILILTTLLGINVKAQNQMGWVSKFGMAVGFTPTWIIPNLDPLNEMLPGFGVPELTKSGLITLGGGGYAYILMIDNVRIGGVGFGGSVSTDANVAGVRKEVEYSTGAGAFTIEYTMPFIKNFAVSIGAMIGGGFREIKIYQNSGKFSWNGTWNGFSDSTKNVSRTLENKFFTVTPTINVDIPLNRFIAFRLGGGYIIPFSNKWKIENRQDLNGVPSDLSGNTFFIQTGIFVGFFAF